MALRSVEIIIQNDLAEQVQEILDGYEISDRWKYKAAENQILFKCLTTAEKSEQLLDDLEKKFSHSENFKIILSAVEATIPRYEEPEEKEEEQTEEKKEVDKKQSAILRISREELYTDIVDFLTPSVNFVVMMILASIVAGIGILQDNVAIIIGAMVIAPLLGPNVALSFATTLGDLELIKKSIIVGVIGIGIAFVTSVLWGLIDPSVSDISEYSMIQYSQVILAFVSGVAGVMAILRGTASALVGVMVAVALLPPLVKAGLLLGGGYWIACLNALLIFTSNIICLNLAGILTFVTAGIQPNQWWEAKKAKKHMIQALILWTVLLVILVLIIVYMNIGFADGNL